MEDAETGERVLLDTSHGPTRTRVRVAAERQLQERSRKLIQAGVDRVALQTGVPYAAPLRRAFAERARRLLPWRRWAARGCGPRGGGGPPTPPPPRRATRGGAPTGRALARACR